MLGPIRTDWTGTVGVLVSFHAPEIYERGLKEKKQNNSFVKSVPLIYVFNSE